MSTFTTILSFLVAIGVLVTVHEFGHFWVARRLGVKVLRFSVGFGRALWRRQGADGTEYVLAAIPLGGYVKMLDEREGDVAPHELHRAFNRQTLWVRYAVVAAGPAFNFAFAILAYWVMFMLGVSGLRAFVGEVDPNSIAARAGLQPEQQIVAVAGEDTATWVSVVQATMGGVLRTDRLALSVREPGGASRDLELDLSSIGVDDLTEGRFFTALGVQPLRARIPATLGQVVSGGAAERAGLRAGDTVLASDGESVAGWAEWVNMVRASPGESMVLTIERDARREELLLTPAVQRNEDGLTVGYIGAGVRQPTELVERLYVTERHGPLAALDRALDKTWDVSALTLRMFWKMLQLEVSVQNLSGPISIAQYAGDSARGGPSRFLEFLAIVSVSLGILNLLPIPMLDGGHLLWFTVEAAKGSPVSERVQYLGQHLGLMLLVGLMGLAFYNDIARLLG